MVWDVETGRPLYRQPRAGSRALQDLAFSPDGERLAGVSREQVHVWDVATGQEVLVLHGAPRNTADGGFNPKIAWSPDGRRLAATQWNGEVCVWHAPAGGDEGRDARLRAASERAFAWHLAALNECRGDPVAVERHLRFLVELEPPTPELAARRARWILRSGW
jgi:WD40 repeat protein